MVGLMQIMIYMLAVYLVFKGVEIFQIAFMSAREDRSFGMLIGALFICLSLAAGIGFSAWATLHAKEINDRFNNIQIPNLQR